MKNIENFKKQHISYLAKLDGKKVDELTEREMRTYSPIAEFWAYTNSVIPDGFGSYSIFDFNGRAINKKDNSMANTISSQVAFVAKSKICKFCWNLKWEEVLEKYKKDKKSASKYLRDNYEIINRYNNGNNIVIFGQSQQPIGRTMLASIVMKEAIKLRIPNKNNKICGEVRGHSYDWVDFSQLFRVIEQDRMEGGDATELISYSACDWLVVDNIQKKLRSEKQRTLMSDLLDPFFLSRYRNRQPTILVFKFDIRDKHFDLEKAFGIGIGRILESKRTFKIPLSENLMNG